MDGDTIRNESYVKNKRSYSAQPILIKSSPTAFLWGGILPFTSEYRLMAEVPSAKKQSEVISFSYLGKNIFLGAVQKLSAVSSNRILKVSGWRFQYAHKFYLVRHERKAPYGFYVAPLISYSNVHVSIGLNRYYHQTYFDFRNLSENLVIGVQSGKSKHFSTDIYFGMGHKSNTTYYHAGSYHIFQYDTSDFGDFYNGHVSVIFDINIGYRF